MMIFKLNFKGTCFDFNGKLNNTLIVASETGMVIETSQVHFNQILTSYQAHELSVQAVKWNPFYKRVFLTCSADGTVKIWDHRYR